MVSTAFLRDREHLIEKWETLKPDGTKTHFEFELTRAELATGRVRPTADRTGINSSGK